ncbi:hypothetical protein C0993_007774 [Termitomyces sp. T159_Od127]|nr:hypothetical protein C0993_007774 [Termitomyces sp. T159_Od127]
MMLVQDVSADLLMVRGIDLSILKQESVVGGEGEGAVVVGLVGGGGSGVMLSEEGVPGSIANLSPDEGVGLGTKSAGVVVDSEVVLGKDFRPTGLVAAELLGHGEVLQVVVVRVDLDVMRGALEVELRGDHRAGVESNGLELVTARVLLQEYTGNGIVGGVAFEDDGERGVEVAEDGGGGEGFLEESEYTLALAVSVPSGVLPCKPVEGFGDPRVVIYELAVEIGKTKERLHLFYALG